MSKEKLFSIGMLILLAVASSACGVLGPKAQPTMDPLAFQATLNAAATQALQTIVAQFTQTAQAQPATQVPTQEPTVKVFTPTSEPTATATLVPTLPPTATRVPPTAAPTNSPTPKPFECAIVSQSPAIGAKMTTGTDFDMVWTLKNIGTDKWELGAVDIRYVSGDKLQKFGDIFDIAKTVNPGEQITITIDMLAPGTAGTYKAVWNLLGTTTICTMNMQVVVQAP